MIRPLLLAIIGGVIYWLWKKTMSGYARFKQNFTPGGAANKPKDSGTELKTSELVQDPVCKLYIAKETAISYKNRYFCSEKCKGEYGKKIREDAER